MGEGVRCFKPNHLLSRHTEFHFGSGGGTYASPHLSPSLVLGQGRVGLSAYRTELTDTPGRRAGEAAGATKSWKAVQNKKEGTIHFCLNYLNIRERKHTGSTRDKNRFKFIDPLRYSSQPLIQSPRKDRPSLGCSQRTP